MAATPAASAAATGAPPPPPSHPVAPPLAPRPPPPPALDGPSRAALGGLRALDLIGTSSFAISGGLLAAASGMDALGVIAVGCITALGGGTVRDGLLLAVRPFWVAETEYLGLAAASAAAAFVALDETVDDHPVLWWTDAAGVGAFAVIGIRAGRAAGGVGWGVAGLCGVATATFGGVVRDVLVGRKVRILHSHAEVYASCAAVAAATYAAVAVAGGGVAAAVVGGVATGVAARYAAWSQGVRLPVWALGATDTAAVKGGGELAGEGGD